MCILFRETQGSEWSFFQVLYPCRMGRNIYLQSKGERFRALFCVLQLDNFPSIIVRCCNGLVFC